MVTTAVTLGRRARSLERAVFVRRLPAAVVGAAVAFALVWVLFWAPGTTFGSAVTDPNDFLITVLDSVTIAGLYFVIAAGFTLIFGLMRVVNMAHGTFFLLGGYFAFGAQQCFVGGTGQKCTAGFISTGSGGLGLVSSQVSVGNWVFPLLIATGCVAIVGLLIQQIFLRWNQGQELRQALITIAISIIAADLMLAHFGGTQEGITWPRQLDTATKRLHLGAISYSWSRLFILFVAIGIGIALWLWLQKTRTGMVIRAGVDDRQMVSALGVNIQLVFALAFLVGSALAGAGGVMGGSFSSVAPGVDGNWLLNSLVVVIIGGMGSLAGAAVGSLLYGLITSFSTAYLPSSYTPYAITFTFVLLAVVLAVRPFGLFGRPA
jgi:branched-chain amino acid transport system permease protein